jgi:hypothetical protein
MTSEKDRVNKKVESFVRTMKGRGGRGTRVQVTATDLVADLQKVSDEFLKKVCPTAVGYAGSIIRKQAQDDIRNGGSETTIGMSRKTGTRKKWSKKVADKRGRNSPSLGDKGVIIKKNISRKAGGLLSSQIVGPRYNSGSDKDKNFAHTHEPREGRKSGAPNHKWWPRQRLNLSSLLRYSQADGRTTGRRGAPLKARPFMGPAANKTIPQQRDAVIKALKRWEVDMNEVNGTGGGFG